MRVIHWSLMMLILPTALYGQQASAECSRRTIPLAVLDRDYRFVDNLKPARLRIRSADHTLAINSMTLTSPRRLKVLLDVSGSMVQKNKWHVLQLLAHDVVRAAPPDVEIALSTFANDYREIIVYAQDRNAIRRALAEFTYDTLKARKGTYRTSLADALVMALRQQDTSSMGDVIYVLTDGDDNLSKGKLRDVQKELLQRGVRPYFFFVREQRPQVDNFDSSDFRRVAAASGGYVVDLAASREPSLAYASTDFYYDLNKDNLRDLAAAANILYTSMFRFYSLDLQIPEGLQKLDSKLKVSVVDERGQLMKRVDVIHPRQLLRCAAAATAVH